ncbi:MAG TPA: DUF6687 family protein [Acidimicrobiia bacterium]
MLPLRFVAYDDLGDAPNVVVDGAAAASTRLTLSHWPGSPTPPEVRDDLSAQIAFRALGHPDWFDGIDIVSNNHFDQDGLASAYALVDPPAATARRDRVIDVARAGDFGTFADRDAARIAMAIAAYEDPHTSPLGAAALGGSYPEITATLYRELLPRFTEMLDHPDRHRALWEHEDAHLGESITAIERGTVRVEEHAAADLAVVTVPDEWAARATHRFTQEWTEAVHPMAVNNATERLRILLVHGHHYRLELRYESWVMFVSRAVLARPDLRPLATELSEAEPDGAHWEADPPGALTPQLRITGGAGSGLAPEQVTATIERFLATAPAAWDPFASR